MPGRPKTFLFLIRSGPILTGMPDEIFDVALSAASFGQEVSIAFIDDGIFRLLALTPDQMFAFAEHDIESVIVERESLVARSIDPASLPSAVASVPRKDVAHLIAAADVTISA